MNKYLYPITFYLLAGLSWSYINPVESHAGAEAESVTQLEGLFNRAFREDSKLGLGKKVESWIHATDGGLDGFSQFQLSEIFYMLSQISKNEVRFKIPERFVNELLENSADRMQFEKGSKFNGKDLSTIIYSLSPLRITPSEAFLKAWTTSARQSIKTFNAQELSNSLYAFTQLGVEPSRDFIRDWTKAAIAVQPPFNGQNRSNSLYAFHKLSVLPSNEFLKNWMDEETSRFQLIENEKAGSVATQHLANNIFALSMLGVDVPDEFLNLWLHEATKNLSLFNPQELSNILYGLVVLDAKKTNTAAEFGTFLSQLMDTILKLHSKNSNTFTLPQLNQIHLGLQYLNQFRNKNYELPNMAAIRQKLYSDRRNTNTSSVSEKAFGSYLRGHFPQHKIASSYWFEPLATFFDYAIEDQKIAIQYDGPIHYVQAPNGERFPRAKDSFQNKMIRKLGWEVVRVPYFLFQAPSKVALNALLDEKVKPASSVLPAKPVAAPMLRIGFASSSAQCVSPPSGAPALIRLSLPK